MHSKDARRDAEGRRLLVRIGILNVPPALGLIFGFAANRVWFCLAMALFWSLLEASLFYRIKLTATCRKIPFILRMIASLCLDVQFCWLLPEAEIVDSTIQTISVVLPCANESDYVFKTVKAVFEATPRDQMHEIVVVDDASYPLISETISAADLEKYRARILRHDEAQGLIRSKKHGADSATGDIIVFLDCHVKPIGDWTNDLFQNIRENPKRIVVPTITSLDPDTWEEVGGSAGGRKMCLTWNADFYWCNGYPGKYVPIMSGGLLALSRYWWEATGGYDSEMHAWGGENLDQSLRTWLCGGEIVVAQSARVAHMWRDPSKPKTMLHYAIPTEHVLRNRLRAATSWMGPWAKKVGSFQEYTEFREGGSWHLGSLANVEKYQKDLQCKDFRWYLNRFKDLYAAIGGLPESVYNLRDTRSGLCLHHELNYGSSNGGRMNLRPCNRESEAQRWHFANAASAGKPCCSGIKLHDIDVCLDTADIGDSAHAEGCFNFGESSAQWFRLSSAGLLEWQNGRGCVMANKVDIDAFKAGFAPTKATFLSGTTCSARIEELSSLKTGEFKVVRRGKQTLCLSIGEGDAWLSAGSHLLFVPCDENDSKQVFRYGDTVAGDQYQIKTSSGACVDSANGEGPLSYECHATADQSVVQQFRIKAGEAVVWHRKYDGEEEQFSCIEPALDTIMFTVCALSPDGVSAKPGQGFRKHNVKEDGSFQLRDEQTDSCLVPFKPAGSEVAKLATDACVDRPGQRWLSFPTGELKNVETQQCIDSNDNVSPIMYTCYEPGSNAKQQLTWHENGWLEIPRSWADNGRVRYLGQCFDSKAVDPVPLTIQECSAASGNTWEKIWEEVPMETKLWNEQQGNLRSR